MPEPVSLYIIAFNEAQNLREVLPTVLWADEVFPAQGAKHRPGILDPGLPAGPGKAPHPGQPRQVLEKRRDFRCHQHAIRNPGNVP